MSLVSSTKEITEVLNPFCRIPLDTSLHSYFTEFEVNAGDLLHIL